MRYEPIDKQGETVYQVQRLDGWAVGEWQPVGYELPNLTRGAAALRAYRAEQPSKTFRLVKVEKSFEVVEC